MAKNKKNNPTFTSFSIGQKQSEKNGENGEILGTSR